MDSNQLYSTLITNPQWFEREVVRQLHERDAMASSDQTHYHYCGWDALRNIGLSLCSGPGKPRPIPGRILDYGCGHGRVARYLSAAFSNAEFTFCDIDPTGAAFCADRFNGSAMAVTRDLVGFDSSASYDLIWVGSVFTHLEARKSEDLLRMLFGSLAPGGTLVLSSHGRYLQAVRRRGTWYYNITEQQFDEILDQALRLGYGFTAGSRADYGISVAFPGWWDECIQSLDGASIVLFSERGWAQHQDVIALRRGE